jgi:hypothetical protein
MKLDSKYFDCIRVKPDGSAPAAAEPRTQRCQWTGCAREGEFRAPQGRGREGRYFLFCIEHVREYNSKYNYFSGMSDDQVAAFQKDAITGHRPTWTMGTGGTIGEGTAEAGDGRRGIPPRFSRVDPYDLFDRHATGGSGAAAGAAQPRRPVLGKLAVKSLRMLNLEPPASREQIKDSFKSLVKRHHPDANGGDKGSEDRLREIIQAYNYLKQAGLC